jgi:integrase/recombinase XerD
VKNMRALKHLRVSEWPQADRDAFTSAYEPGDVFEDSAGPGAHLSDGSRTMITSTYRRWLGFLKAKYPDDLSISPAERMTPERVRAFIGDLSANRRSSVAIAAARLYDAARLIAPTTDWSWLRSLKSRLGASVRTMDRFDRLVPPVHTLDYGIELMDAALTLPSSDGHKQREIKYRDGLLLALRTIWPIRRRSIAALTVSRHLEFDDAGVNILLYPSDAKAKRAESVRVPEQLLPYLMRYLKEIRPVLLGRSRHDGFWASYRRGPLSAGRIYDMVRARVRAKFGKATFLAMDAPEKIGLIPGVLQHASPQVSEQHYNLARSVEASRRFAAHLANARNRLRPLAKSSTMQALRETATAAKPNRDQNAVDRPARDDALRSSGIIKHRDRGEPSCA